MGSFRGFALTGAMAIFCLAIAGCGGDTPATTPTPAPSAEADALFQTGLARMEGTRSLRFETNAFDGGTLVSEQLDEQVAPDRGRRTTRVAASGKESISTVVGRQIVEVTEGEAPAISELPAEQAFTYPGSWQLEYAGETGFAIVGDETLEGYDATLVRQWQPDAQRPGGFEERLVWIDKASGRILRWDVNKYLMDGDKPRLAQEFISSIWEFDVELTIELPS